MLPKSVEFGHFRNGWCIGAHIRAVAFWHLPYPFQMGAQDGDSTQHCKDAVGTAAIRVALFCLANIRGEVSHAYSSRARGTLITYSNLAGPRTEAFFPALAVRLSSLCGSNDEIMREFLTSFPLTLPFHSATKFN